MSETTLTPALLLAHGYKELSWNSGAIMEYRKSYRKDDKPYNKYCVCVRFGEWQGIDFIPYLCVGDRMLALKHITTIYELETLVNLLRPPDWSK